jgi:nicotinate-nucleotide adenylyltransferase
MTRRIGLLGGTFDPIHRGHLDLAAAAVRALDFTELLLIPAHTPPHRTPPAASGFHRFAMVALAIAGRALWRVSDVELLIDGPSYTSSTLNRLRAEGYRADELFFVVGADAFADVESWKDYPSILDSANFAVLSRPGHPVDALAARLPALASRMIRQTSPISGGTAIFLIDAATADVSSTAIRQRLARGESIRDFVSPEVEQHIQRHGLYAARAAVVKGTGHAGGHTAGRLHGEDR